ncbi:hypothetical protein GMORB2_1084 [Geosmithia morbida]|uniref:Uncharacterized protein n=1 Tax=Geosmithia morbida TaxID=1094350 RepID=A0A9P5D357_9HYPO|nr:uncharacterized protein GMORB2_1084 [Geosmithia morbida]KAF4125838.1 hypothetical protein GMORB2_1084 [Geosmithia morbida]
MTQPAFEQLHTVQDILYNVQMSLRRMPGVSSSEADKIINKLKDVGCMVNKEIVQLVDALTNLAVDGEETANSLARFSIDASVAKATLEERRQTIRHLEKELSDERDRSLRAEADMNKMVDDLLRVSGDFPDLSNKAGGEVADSGDESQTDMDKAKKSKEKPEMLACVSTSHEEDDNDLAFREPLERISQQLKSANLGSDGGGVPSPTKDRHRGIDRTHAATPAPGSAGARGPTQSCFPLLTEFRSQTVQPTGYSPLGAGPPRAPSARPVQTSRHLTSWGSTSSGASSSLMSPTSSVGAAGRAPTRRGYQLGRHTTSVFAEQQQQQGLSLGLTRPGTAFPISGRGDFYQPYHLQQLTRGGGRYSNFDAAAVGIGVGIGGAGEMHTSANGGALVPTRNGVAFGGQHRMGPTIQLTERSVMAWSEQISQLYAAIRNFVDAHAAQPMTEDPERTLADTAVWPILMRTYLPLSDAESASYLEFHLRDHNSKRCLVTRVVVDYVVNLVWVPGAWKGADVDTSHALVELERDLARASGDQYYGQTSSSRQPLLDRQSAIIDSIMKEHAPSSPFHKGKMEEISGMLLNSLRPLLNPRTSAQDAYGHLVAVAEKAWDLSSKILSSRLTFDFRFPEIGTRFSTQSMVPVWPVDVDPVELQTRHWRVAMVTTPVITCRNDTGSNISAHSVCHADVICMQ